jgi:hypothetical protein
VPKRNWIIVIVVSVAVYTWQRMSQDGPSMGEPDLRTFSSADLDAAKSTLVFGLGVVTTPATCSRDHGAYPESTWKPVVDGWNDRNQALLETVIRILEDTGAARDRRRHDDEAKRQVGDRLALWKGHEAEACGRFLAEVSDGRWDIARNPTTAASVALIEAASAKEERRR